MRIRWGGEEYPMITEDALTLGEAAAIERHFRGSLEDFGTTTLTIGLLYCSVRRRNGKVTWEGIEGVSAADLDNLLIAEPEDVDEAPDPTTPPGQG